MSSVIRAGALVATLAFFLVAAAGSGVFAQDTSIETGDLVVVNNGTLKLRAEASVDADVVEVLAEGTILTVIGGPEDADGLTWYQVRTSAGLEGWVSAEYVEETAPVPPVIGDTVAVELGPLNLRETATEDASVVGQLEEGDRATVVDGPVDSGSYSWYQVETDDGDLGWIAADFIRVAPPVGFDPGNQVTVAVGPVNMRAAPSVESDITDTLDQGTDLTVVSGPVAGGDYTWFEVRTTSNETGFVVQTALEAVAGGATATIDFPIGSFVFATETTDVLAAGMIDAAKVSSLEEGDIATVTEGPVVADGFTWFQVSITDAEATITGWVQGESMSGGIVLGTNAVVIDGPLNLRESASTEAESVALLELGDEVNLVSGPQIVEGTAWFEVTAGDDTGYVAGQYLGPVVVATPTAATGTPAASPTPDA